MTTEIRQVTASMIFCQPNFGQLAEEYERESLIDGFHMASPQLAHYQALEQMGALKVLGAFDQDKLIGFIAILITPVPHYEKPLASTESCLVSNSYRKTGAGFALLRGAEAIAKEHGIGHFGVCAPTGGALDKAMSITKGYKQTNKVYTKILK